ncbi:MAG: chloride channel protein [Microthrixaceae bacterium]
MRTQFTRSALSDAVVHIRSGLAPAVIAVGIIGGLVGAAYIGVLHLLTHLLGPTHHSGLVQIGIFLGVGAAVAAITHFGGETGDVELLVANIHVLGGAEDVKSLRSLIPASLLCVAAGAGMGPEAPMTQTTGTLGTLIATKLNRPMTDVRTLTITGMAAGLTVLFGAPLGSALFALEILHRRGLQYYEALLPAIVGSLCGLGIYVMLGDLGIKPIWSFPPVPTLHASDLAIAVGLGLVGAIGSMIFAKVAQILSWIFSFAPSAPRYVLGGLALGLLGLWSPYALTNGKIQLEAFPDLRLGAGVLAVATLAKLLGTTVTMASGWKGGFIIPLFFMGSTLGQLLHVWVPGVHVTILMACLMIALNVGVTKTPLGSTLVVTEMAGLTLLPVTIIAAVVALVATSSVNLIDTQRARDLKGGVKE